MGSTAFHEVFDGHDEAVKALTGERVGGEGRVASVAHGAQCFVVENQRARAGVDAGTEHLACAIKLNPHLHCALRFQLPCFPAIGVALDAVQVPAQLAEVAFVDIA